MHVRAIGPNHFRQHPSIARPRHRLVDGHTSIGRKGASCRETTGVQQLYQRCFRRHVRLHCVFHQALRHGPEQAPEQWVRASFTCTVSASRHHSNPTRTLPVTPVTPSTFMCTRTMHQHVNRSHRSHPPHLCAHAPCTMHQHVDRSHRSHPPHAHAHAHSRTMHTHSTNPRLSTRTVLVHRAGLGLNVINNTYDFQSSIAEEGGPSNSLPWVLGANPSQGGFQFGILFNSPALGGVRNVCPRPCVRACVRACTVTAPASFTLSVR